MKQKLLADFSRRSTRPDVKPITFVFDAQLVELLGRTRVAGVRVLNTGAATPVGEEDVLECGLVLRSIGYRGAPILGLPFRDVTGTVLNDAGRVIDAYSGEPIAGRYVTGWIERGPSGVIGTNRLCAYETVDSIIVDHQASLLPDPTSGQQHRCRGCVRRRR